MTIYLLLGETYGETLEFRKDFFSGSNHSSAHDWKITWMRKKALNAETSTCSCNIRAAKGLQEQQCCFWMMKTTACFHSCFVTSLKPLALLKAEILHTILHRVSPAAVMCDQPKRQWPTFVPLKNLSVKKILQGSDIRLWMLSYTVLKTHLRTIYDWKKHFLLKLKEEKNK